MRLFIKLPNWFKVGTPVGQYNPDWGLVMEQVFGEDGPLLYLVRETRAQLLLTTCGVLKIRKSIVANATSSEHWGSIIG